ncbi:MAG: PASTA domain-containing protein, partial [Firmicutes bacterium]|nr:PASTA domain-containing protein [Bacillota bacterium]
PAHGPGARWRRALLALTAALPLLVLAACGGGGGTAAGGSEGGSETGSEPASNYPERPVELVAAGSPGGGLDILARSIQEAITKEGLVPRVRRIANSEVEEGVVFEQSPYAGVRVEEGSIVVIDVSSGRPEVTVPSVVGQTVGEALAKLSAAGLRVEVSGEATGVVAAQVPGPEAKVAPGTLVLLEVSPGGPSSGLVTVPDLRGRTMAEAALMLEKAGLHLAVEGSGVAVGQSPAAGTWVQEGTVVTVRFEPPPR